MTRQGRNLNTGIKRPNYELLVEVLLHEDFTSRGSNRPKTESWKGRETLYQQTKDIWRTPQREEFAHRLLTDEIFVLNSYPLNVSCIQRKD